MRNRGAKPQTVVKNDGEHVLRDCAILTTSASAANGDVVQEVVAALRPLLDCLEERIARRLDDAERRIATQVTALATDRLSPLDAAPALQLPSELHGGTFNEEQSSKVAAAAAPSRARVDTRSGGTAVYWTCAAARGAARLGTLVAAAKATQWAYEIRIFAIRKYGPVIHEFDPWFNFRATQYLAERGVHSFFTWFDHMSWYPLGRPVATTIYPGMQFASVAIWRVVEAMGASWSLEEVCCYVPVGFGIASIFFVALLVRESVGPGSSASYVAAAVSAMVMAVVPAHAQRSVGGAFDNESVAIPAMCATFFLWCRSLRNSRSWPVAVLAGLAYGFMAASWGGYIIALNVVGLHAAVLFFAGYGASCSLHQAYSVFFIVGTGCAICVPIIGWAPFRSAEQLGPLGVFCLLQVAQLRDRLRARVPSANWILMFVGASMALILGLLIQQSVFWPFSSRVRALFMDHAAKTGNPLADSVAEHQPKGREAYYQFLHNALYLAPLGVPALLLRPAWPSEAAIFLLLQAATSCFFALRMSRLILLLAPVAAGLSGAACGRFFEWTISPLERQLLGPTALEDTYRVLRTYNSVPIRLLRIGASVAVFIVSTPHAKEFLDACFRTVESSMSEPRIIQKSKEGQTIDDYREAYWWLRDHTPVDARIMSLWEYGYHIAGMGNRTSLHDGNTWNFDHVGLVGLCLTSPVQEAHRVARHLADFILVWINDDLGKTAHMARIANRVYPGHCAEDDCDEFGVLPDGKPTPMIGASLMWSLTAQGLKDHSFSDSENFRQAYLSKNRKVRIVEILQVSQESRAWAADPRNRLCDAPGSWYCPGQYPPKLLELLDANTTDNAGNPLAVAYRQEFARRVDEQLTRIPKLNGEGIAPGSYLESCRGCSREGALANTKLHCTHCRSPGRASGPSSVDTATCESDGKVDNIDGFLQCEPLPNADNLPKGTYEGSCKGCRLEQEGSWIRCTHCDPGAHKRPVASSYEVSRCQPPGQLENLHGVLTCTGIPQGTGLPEGSYKQSCQGCHVGRLGPRAAVNCSHCGASDGKQLPSSYEVHRCTAPGALENFNGRLRCGGIASQQGIPSGGYQKSCQGCSLQRGGSILVCTHCDAADGSQHESSHPVGPAAPCPGGLDIRVGQLACPASPAPGPVVLMPSGAVIGLPTGTYLQSCEACVLRGEEAGVELYCERCANSAGGRMPSSLLLAACLTSSPVSNNDGQLACLGGIAAGPDTTVIK